MNHEETQEEQREPDNTVLALRRDAESTPVSALMTRQVTCLVPTTQMATVTEMFLERELSSAPVVDADKIPVGMVTKTDLLRQLSARSSGTNVAAPTITNPQVADITRPKIFCLHEDTSVSVAAALMAHQGIHRLPIVSTGGRLVGIVSTLDIVRWLAKATGMGQAER